LRSLNLTSTHCINDDAQKDLQFQIKSRARFFLWKYTENSAKFPDASSRSGVTLQIILQFLVNKNWVKFVREKIMKILHFAQIGLKKRNCTPQKCDQTHRHIISKLTERCLVWQRLRKKNLRSARNLVES